MEPEYIRDAEGFGMSYADAKYNLWLDSAWDYLIKRYEEDEESGDFKAFCQHIYETEILEDTREHDD